MSRFRRAAAAVALAALTFIAVSPATASAAVPEHRRGATQRSYVALGDSFAAGVGAAPALDGCGSSAMAYPRLLAKLTRTKLTLAACGGATMADVATEQLDALAPSTDYVTLQAGGNDIGFVPVFGLCAQPDNDAQCAAALGQSKAYLDSGFTDNARTLMAAVRARAPKAKLIVVGYPRLFNGTDCSQLVAYSAAEQQLMNATIDLLNTRLAQAAAQVGASFANPTSAFRGHAWCGRPSWITGPENPVAFHPNALGQLLGYLPVVARKLL
ncbi:MAG: SGNH/GDSL hydrolase family protein [Micropruina sp.]|uniref:SGNH/GDSL hydrolase family protein n=1 Tax=Micropruina sp. TaxID=2737536 RepID=UPI0039E58BC3